MPFSRARTVLLASVPMAALAASILATAPRTAEAQSDECIGHSLPWCKTVKSCVSVNGGPSTCTTDFYYYADAT